MSSASTPTQHRQFFQINTHTGVSNMFTEEFVQLSPLEEFFQADQSRPSSSSSSLRSLSVGSPDILSKATTSHLPDANQLWEAAPMEQPTPQPVMPHQATMEAYGHARNIHFPSPTGDDAAMARAMLAVISSASSLPSPVHASPRSGSQSQARRRGGAFGPYDSSASTKVEGMQIAESQDMMKRAFSILGQIRSSTNAVDAQTTQETPRPSSNQLHHMMSERKRREKLNESFDGLRSLLPSGTKRDKASILTSTIAYVNTLKAQISDLGEKNRLMETRLLPSDEAGEDDDVVMGERRRIRLIRASGSSSGSMEMEVRVTVLVECDMIDLVLHILECLKGMKGINLVSWDASIHSRRMNPIRRVILTMQTKGDEWDEDWFKEAVAGAVDETLSPPPA